MAIKTKASQIFNALKPYITLTKGQSKLPVHEKEYLISPGYHITYKGTAIAVVQTDCLWTGSKEDKVLHPKMLDSTDPTDIKVYTLTAVDAMKGL